MLTCSMAVAITAAAGFAAVEPDTPIIPREVLFGNPDRAGVQISPDGESISFLAPVDGVLNVWVGPAGDPAAARPITEDDDRGIRQYSWIPSSSHVVYLQDRGGDENWRAYSVDASGEREIELTPFDNVATRVLGVSEDHPDEMMLLINDRDAALHDVYRVNATTGERELVYQNPKYAGFVVDDDFELHFGMQMTDDGSAVMESIDAESGDTDTFMEIPFEDSLTTNVLGVLGDGRVVVLDSRGRDTAALFMKDPTTGSMDLIFEDSRADVSGVMIDPVTEAIEAVAVNYKKNEWTPLDDEMRRDLAYLRKEIDKTSAAGGEINVGSRTLDDAKWIVTVTDDDGPVTYFSYERTGSKSLTKLFTNRPDLESVDLAPMHPVVIEARDGLELVSYLTLPSWADSDGDGRPEDELPMVLLVHGGPWARDGWGYNTYHQWLANRGYAVLSVNFRGSTGFGKAFLNAGNNAWHKEMHTDLLDAVDWAVDEGVAIEDRVAIMGGSYGGYATLAGLTFSPEVFACGVDIVGPSNIVTLLESIPPYWGPMRSIFTQRVGDPDTEEGRALLKEMSPLTHVDRISRPLLIGQGANDPRVKQAESDQIADAMKEKGLPVTYVLFPDEGHGFARPENNTAFNAITEVFLAKHLGGRLEPLSSEIDASSAVVLSLGNLDLPVEEASEYAPETLDLTVPIAYEDLTDEQKTMVDRSMGQIDGVPAQMLPMVIQQIEAQAASAPPEVVPVVRYIYQQVKKRAEGDEG